MPSLLFSAGIINLYLSNIAGLCIINLEYRNFSIGVILFISTLLTKLCLRVFIDMFLLKTVDVDTTENEYISDTASENDSIIDIETIEVDNEGNSSVIMDMPQVENDDFKTAYHKLYESYVDLHLKYNELQKTHNNAVLQIVKSDAIRRTIEKDKEQMWKLLALALKP